ncbi:MAG: hypothetical protein HOH16_13195 [Planctomycetaceae bacterium]|nr:hypothetical protein [Planctomycetaceae bacterium]
MPNEYKISIAMNHQSHFVRADLGRMSAVIFHEHSWSNEKSIEISPTDPTSIGLRYAYGIY